MKKRKAYVISHTHWDREWYQTFQQYRRRLCRMLDGLIDGLEQNPAYICFHLDGQTVLIQDYLEIRPEKRERLLKLIRDGRIIIGPWYVMPDEFLVSGESLIKNLQKGRRICQNLGAEPMMSGYVTDIFGHNSQFPQILRGFGIDNALLYRGIGDYPKDRFCWEAADGSSVTVVKMDKDRSYSNFYFALRWPYERMNYDKADMIRRAQKLIDKMQSMTVGNVLLMMDGVDHMDMEENLPQMIETLNQNLDGIEFIHAPFSAFLDDMKRDAADLETIKGPLYHLGEKGINNQLLKNVLSSMVHLKQANDACERKLSRMAAPLEALLYQNWEQLKKETVTHTMLPLKGYLEKAWDYLLKNQPHDSICGCSITEVHQDNEYRFRQCEQIADMMIEETLSILAQNIAWDDTEKNSGFLVYHFGQEIYRGIAVIEAELPIACGTDFSLYDSKNQPIDYQLLRVEPTIRKVTDYNKLIDFREVQKVTLALPVSMEPFGYTSFTVQSNCHEELRYGDYSYADTKRPYRLGGTMRTDVNRFDNGVLEVEIKTDGSLTITEKHTGRVYEHMLTFEDAGDFGDGWNYRKPVMDRVFQTNCTAAGFSIDSDGKYAAVFTISHRFILPAGGSSPTAREGRPEDLELATRVTLLKGSAQIVFQTTVKNTVDCHRLRVLFPTGCRTDSYVTATPFDMQKWPVTKADNSRHAEVETNVTPSQGITWIGGEDGHLALYTKGLYEVEVMDNPSRTLALTLFRAFRTEIGTLVRDGANMNRPLCFDYAVDFGAESPANAVLTSDGFRCGMQTVPLAGKGVLPMEGCLAQTDGGAVLSTMEAESKQMAILRFVNYKEETVSQSVTFHRKVCSAMLIDFTGIQTEEEVTCERKQIRFSIAPHQIRTVKVVFE